MTPGTAAAPAPGCWLRCLRTLRFGNAAGQLLLPEVAKEYGTKPEAAQCPALILRITWLRLFAIAKAIDVQRLLHSHNPRYTHNRAGQISGSGRARATSGSG